MSEKLSIEQIEKIGNTVIYLSTRVGELARTKLLKILFLIEEKSIKELGKPFFGLDFKVWQFGPVVEPVYYEITNQVDLFKDYFRKNRFDEFEAVKQFNDDEFSINDIKLLDQMVNFARHKIASDFVRLTHAPGSLWTKTAKKHGVYEELEYGDLKTTDYNIDFSMLFENDPGSFIAEKYSNSIENSVFSQNFKKLKD